MTQLTTDQYDRLERAVNHGQRIIVQRRGTEYVLVPLALGMRDGREMIDAKNPTTGDRLALFLDEVESIEMVG